jgi:hypothetical protein
MKHKKNLKKGQLSQVFIYIFAAILAVAIMLYGYRAIKGFGERTEQISLVRFKTDLEAELRQMASDYGSVKKAELSLSTKYSKVCFVDFTKPAGVVEDSKICTPGNPDYNPLGCDAWKDKTQNIFLVPWTDFVIKTEKIKISEQDGAICIPNINGKIILRLEGLGDSTLIKKWED